MDKAQHRKQVKKYLKKHARSGKLATALMDDLYGNIVATLGYAEPEIVADAIWNLSVAISIDKKTREGWVVEFVD